MATYGDRLAAQQEVLRNLPVKVGDDIPNENITYGELFGDESLMYALAQDSVDPVLAAGLREKLGEEEYNFRIEEFQKEKALKYKQYLRPPSTLTEQDIFPEYTARLNRYDQAQDRQRRQTMYERGNYPESFLTPEDPIKPIGYDRAIKLRDFGYDPREELNIEGIKKFRAATAAMGFYTPSPEDMNYQKNYLGTDIINRMENPEVRGPFAEKLPGEFQWAIPGDKDSGMVYVENGKAVLFDSPMFTAGDAGEFALQEGPLIAADLLLGLKGVGKFSDEILTGVSKGKGKLRKFGDNFAFNLLLSGGTAATRFTQLLLGSSAGVHNRDITAMAKEAGLIGMIALGGNTMISAFMEGIPAVYRSLAGRRLAMDQIEALQNAFDQANASRTAGGVRIKTESGEFEGVTLKDIDKTIAELGEEIGENLGRYKPNLSQATKDSYIADLEQEVIKKASDPKYAKIYDEMMKGNKETSQKLFKAIFQDLNNETTGNTVAKEIVDVFKASSKSFEDEGLTIMATLRSDLDNLMGIAKGKNVLDEITDPAASSRLIERFTKRINLIARDSKDKLTKEVDNIFVDPQLKNLKLTGRGFRKEFDELENATLAGTEINIGQAQNNKMFNKIFPEELYNRFKSTKDKTFSLSELNKIRTELNNFASKNLNPGQDVGDQKLFESIRTLQESIEDTMFNQIHKALPKKQADIYVDLINAQKFGIELANQQSIKNLMQTQPEGVTGYLLALQPAGASGNTRVKGFMEFLKATNSYDEINIIRNDLVDYVKRNYLDETMGDPITLARGYQKFLKEKLPTLKLIFPEEQFNKIVATRKSFNEKIIKPLEQLNKENDILASQFGDSNPFNIVTRVLSTGEGEKAGGNIVAKLNSLERLLDGADAQTRKIIEKNLSDATKKYILQRSSVDGVFNVKRLNDFMNQGFAPAELVGQNLSFEGVLGRLIQDDKKFFSNLNVLRDVGMRTQQNIGSDSVLRRQMSQELFDPGTEYLRRFFIPPLTKFGRRATALENLVENRNANFLGEVLQNEELFNAYVQALTGQKRFSQFFKILNTYDTIHSADIGATANYYNEADKKQKIYERETMSPDAEEDIRIVKRLLGRMN
jgi:hypothetical protein